MSCNHVAPVSIIFLTRQIFRLDTNINFFNRLMQAAATNHISLGVQSRLKSSHLGCQLLMCVSVCVKQTETSPRLYIVLCVTAPFVQLGIGRYSLYKRVGQGAEKERKIKVRMISTDREKRR